MFRPYESLSKQELGDQFAAAVRMGGRPVLRDGMHLAYADLALELVLEEFKHRYHLQRAAELSSQAIAAVDGEIDDLPF